MTVYESHNANKTMAQTGFLYLCKSCYLKQHLQHCIYESCKLLDLVPYIKVTKKMTIYSDIGSECEI